MLEISDWSSLIDFYDRGLLNKEWFLDNISDSDSSFILWLRNHEKQEVANYLKQMADKEKWNEAHEDAMWKYIKDIIEKGEATNNNISEIAERTIEERLAILEKTLINYINLTEIGTIQFSGNEEVPAGWMLCDGRRLEILTFVDLYGKLGNRFGGDGKTYFFLPKLSCGYIYTGVSSVQEKKADVRSFMVNGVSFRMIHVEGGSFMMGSDSDIGSDEKPIHEVTLSSFYIGEFQVTQSLWEAVIETNPSQFKGENLPVECVSWSECQNFLTKLSSLIGLTFRLPTESEWEYAARGGNHSCGYEYSGSNDIDEVAWYGGNSNGKTHNVGSKRSNELGLFDMSGNVWEWCDDWYGAYPSSPQTNPKGLSSGTARVFRGGSWNYATLNSFRLMYRNYGSDVKYAYLGFRVVLIP